MLLYLGMLLVVIFIIIPIGLAEYLDDIKYNKEKQTNCAIMIFSFIITLAFNVKASPNLLLDHPIFTLLLTFFLSTFVYFIISVIYIFVQFFRGK